jgi:hypothetical protein
MVCTLSNRRIINSHFRSALRKAVVPYSKISAKHLSRETEENYKALSQHRYPKDRKSNLRFVENYQVYLDVKFLRTERDKKTLEWNFFFIEKVKCILKLYYSRDVMENTFYMPILEM